MRAVGFRLFLAGCLIAGIAAVATAPAQPSPVGSSIVRSNGTDLPQEIADVLEAKAAAYRRRARKFSCTETIRASEYGREGAGREKVREYEFLLVEEPSAAGGFRGLRTRLGSSGNKEKKVNLPFPEPYLWSQIFSRGIRSTLRYRVGQWHTTPWKLAIPVSWISSAPVSTRERITEWSGTVEVEYRTGNLIRLVAQPNFQEERILAQLEKFLTAFRVLGFSLAPAPVGLELQVDYRYEHEGFTYPTRVELRTFRQIHRGTRITVSRQIAEYSDYRFFGTRTQENIPPLVYQPPAPEDSPNEVGNPYAHP